MLQLYQEISYTPVYRKMLPDADLYAGSEHTSGVSPVILLQRMSYYYNDDDASECPVCYRVFDNGRNWRANQNSMEMHLQVKFNPVSLE